MKPGRHEIQPSIAVVIPCWNAERWIGRAVQSVLKQDYPALEIIVVDDGSADQSPAIVRSFGEQVTCVCGPNRGACAARNRGMELARSEYVLFLDADDYLVGQYVASLAAEAEATVDLVIGGYARRDESGALSATAAYENIADSTALISKYLETFLQTSGFLWRKSFLEAGGGWDERLTMYQDADLALRMFLRRPKFRIAKLRDSFAVWDCHNGPDRITKEMTREKIASAVASLDGLTAAIVALESADANRGLARRYYNLAMSAYSGGFDDLGQDMERRSRQLGAAGHFGGHVHRLASSVLGLKRKIHVAKFVDKARQGNFWTRSRKPGGAAGESLE